MRLFIVSGISGAGKSVALHALEDLGFHCIDNLPVGLLPAFGAELLKIEPEQREDAAVGIDVRNLTGDLSNFPMALKELEDAGFDCKTVFLDADDATLIKRFSETRRRHPLTDDDLPLEDAIHQERMLLKPVSSLAEILFDTSRTNVHQLREMVQTQLGENTSGTMSVLFQSFGFKHGTPIEADFIFDIRCLPNPHWDPQLRSLTGRDPEVARFLESQPAVGQMFEDIAGFLERWLPAFAAENRSYLTIAIGCTGGQHRSVYFVERLATHFRKKNTAILTRHRELS